ncbi:hypothetical protein GN244_ATG09627 [Phytophthora infestans]|uniref:Uncharacterized protein n=1 Tax=Phytophthora infestans TaxID=4787 RepID=A0A833T376_PHYIN|nr:hypothetical protein GN244_ATG09627 [Phytophthora infestans]
MFDSTGIAKMLEEFIRPICDCTAFVIGEIDDDDGVVNIVFKSNDLEDVTVVNHTDGKIMEFVDVKSRGTITWSSTVSTLQGRTLYLDRWLPGYFGLPGSGGKSLVM